MTQSSQAKPDPAWLKCLLHSRWERGVWKSADVGELKERARKQLEETIPLIYDWLSESASILNLQRTSTEPRFNVLPWNAETDGQAYSRGLVLLCGQNQVKLVQTEQFILQAFASQVRSFQRFSQELYQFQPHFDPFGGLAWLKDRSEVLSPAKVAQLLLQELCRLGLSEQSVAY